MIKSIRKLLSHLLLAGTISLGVGYEVDATEEDRGLKLIEYRNVAGLAPQAADVEVIHADSHQQLGADLALAPRLAKPLYGGDEAQNGNKVWITLTADEETTGVVGCRRPGRLWSSQLFVTAEVWNQASLRATEKLLIRALTVCRNHGDLKVTVVTDRDNSCSELVQGLAERCGFFLDRERLADKKHTFLFYRNLYWRPKNRLTS